MGAVNFEPFATEGKLYTLLEVVAKTLRCRRICDSGVVCFASESTTFDEALEEGEQIAFRIV